MSHGGEVRSVPGALLDERIVLLVGDIDMESATLIVGQLLLLDAQDPEAEIRVYINSTGGDVHAGLAIYDTMQLLRAPVATYAIGSAASMAAWILAAGTKGRRYVSPNSWVMIHQGAGRVGGKAEDIQVRARHLLDLERQCNEILARHTGKTVDQIEQDVRRDFWMRAGEAVEYGIADGVLGGRKET